MDDDTNSDADDPSEPEGGSDDRRHDVPEDPEPRVVRRTRNPRRGRSGRSGAVVGRGDEALTRGRGARTGKPEPEDTEPEDTEPEDTEPEDTEPEDTEPEDTEPEDTEPAQADDADSRADDLLDTDRASVMPPADQPGPLLDEVVPASPAGSTRSMIVLVGVAAVVLGLLTWVAFFRPEEVASPPPSTVASTTTTTAPEAGWPAQTTQVATAKPGVAEVTVLSTPPPEWETSADMLRWEAPALTASQATMPSRPALPRPDYDIEGRYATDSGWTFSNPTSFGEPLAFVVTEARGDWVKVLLPVRPNHTEGYVSRDQVDLSQHDYRIELRLSEHRLSAFRGSELIADTPVVTGKDATRTPTGRFFVTDKVEQSNPDGFYGPYVLALNGYSEQLDIFDDGVPVIAIHGTSRPDLLGTSASNGCVRIPNEVITQLHDELPLGTPVEIYA
jgi:hypothetical protein